MSKHPTPSQFARRPQTFTALGADAYTPRQLELFDLDDYAACGRIQTPRTSLEEGAARAIAVAKPATEIKAEAPSGGWNRNR